MCIYPGNVEEGPLKLPPWRELLKNAVLNEWNSGKVPAQEPFVPKEVMLLSSQIRAGTQPCLRTGQSRSSQPHALRSKLM